MPQPQPKPARFESFTLTLNNGPLPSAVYEAITKYLEGKRARDVCVQDLGEFARVRGIAVRSDLDGFLDLVGRGKYLDGHFESFSWGSESPLWAEMVVRTFNDAPAWGLLVSEVGRLGLSWTTLSESSLPRGGLVASGALRGSARVINDIVDRINKREWYPSLDPAIQIYSIDNGVRRVEHQRRVEGHGSGPGDYAGLRQILMGEATIVRSHLEEFEATDGQSHWGGEVVFTTDEHGEFAEIDRLMAQWADAHAGRVLIPDWA